MPGKIKPVAYLSQNEDMDKYFHEYQSLKMYSQNTDQCTPTGYTNNNYYQNFNYNQRTYKSHQSSNMQHSHETLNNIVNNYRNIHPNIHLNSKTYDGNSINQGSNITDFKSGMSGYYDYNSSKSRYLDKTSHYNTPYINSNNNNENYNYYIDQEKNSTQNIKKFSKKDNNTSSNKYKMSELKQKTQYNSPWLSNNSVIANQLKETYPQVYQNTKKNVLSPRSIAEKAGDTYPAANLSFYPHNITAQDNQFPTAISENDISSRNHSSTIPHLDKQFMRDSTLPIFSGNFDFLGPTQNEIGSPYPPNSASKFNVYLEDPLFSSAISPQIHSNDFANNLVPPSNNVITTLQRDTFMNNSYHNNLASLDFGSTHLDSNSNNLTNTVNSRLINNVEDHTKLSTANSPQLSSTSNKILMSDSSLGWDFNGPNNTASRGNSFGIWNSDMSVWS
ncbi:hypothetical protein TBLA_0D00530 [Henningerozyma blattae CBS 6284]|uniref:Uncharacterized protein n=1 Tax=Henningerozyma blattae (strain ATCC 34711 / CBS 6284 / DSM 70876 / NBRC 10599 / NRRL Y-10934 / UCD 77-7) TaxID=1071380 RepID=I2H2G0_HENB6|nr:hypothetical protein TBLA_0D00530 [Tetrapisispora blattae CBS 6284]CCH60562.1 hypothetical protein TBLA_0D00530 [Tetrapisispora blattae CBS 6284]